MTSKHTKSFGTFLCEQLIESVTEPASSKLYIACGKIESWANDSSPPVATDTMQDRIDVWKNMHFAKKITGNDISLVIRRYDWTANTIYIPYTHTNANLYSNAHYVVTSAFNVYRCLDNANNALSTVEPSYTKADITTRTADGYLWKYLYTISRSERLRFMNDDWIPVKTLTIDNGSVQWQVQESAIDGGLSSIIITNPGSGYQNNSNLVVTILGDGSGARANAVRNVTTNGIDYISVTNPGADYTRATATITDISDVSDRGGGATALAVISPPGGHGSNPVRELGATSIMFNVRVKGDENGKLSVGNDFRQVSIIRDPIVSTTGNVSTNTVVNQIVSIDLTGLGTSYINDEWVYQGATLGTSTFRGKVVNFSASNNRITVANTEGTISSDTLIGSNSAATRFITSYENPELVPYSGDVLYIDNVVPITRATTQTEDFKIVLQLA